MSGRFAFNSRQGTVGIDVDCSDIMGVIIALKEDYERTKKQMQTIGTVITSNSWPEAIRPFKLLVWNWKSTFKWTAKIIMG